MIYKFCTILVLAVLLISCEPKDPDITNGEELITTLIYEVTDTNSGEISEFVFRDLDGDDGNDPVITVPVLKSNSSYSGSIMLLNESVDPTESVDEEVAEEDLDHQLFFDSEVLTVAYADTDSEGNPIGLESTFSTGDAGTGTLKITLRHKPSKDAEGVKDNDITNAGGETDIEVTFDVSIED